MCRRVSGVQADGVGATEKAVIFQDANLMALLPFIFALKKKKKMEWSTIGNRA